MKRFSLLFLILCCCAVKAEVGIGTASPASSSVLDLTSTSKGFFLPHMSTSQCNAISSPVAGLFIYNTTTIC